MKKFMIISTALILASAVLFGFSLNHYIQSRNPVETSPSKATDDSPAPTEAATEGISRIDVTLEDNGVFSKYYDKASDYVSGMSKEQMVGQLIVGYIDDTSSAVTDINRYSLAGVQFSTDSFDYMSKDEVKSAVERVRAAAPIAPILAAQEEGGRVNTITSHDAFSDIVFDSPRNIYESDGIAAVEKTEDEKMKLLKELGFNLNLAPVLDLAQEGDQIMYSRSLSGEVQSTSTYAEYVAKFNQAKGVSVALKHFPGYGTIHDTYDSIVVDTRDAATIRNNDYQPFKAGAAAGAHFIMVSNVVVENIDSAHTAALSPTIHRELRDTVGFTGLIITDVLDGTDADYSPYADGRDVAVAAVLAGNDLILVKDYAAAYNAILSAVNDGTISTSILQEVCTRIIAYKYATGLIA